MQDIFTSGFSHITFENSALNVFYIAMATAIATGLGVVPFFFIKDIPKKYLGYANALAAGLMLAASFRLVEEGLDYNLMRLILGLVIGLVFIHYSQKKLGEREDLQVGSLRGADALKAMLIVGVMTLHSFAEGVGVGVSFGGGEKFGLFISSAIAIHNIPEGLAIALILIPEKVPAWKVTLWAIFSSLPQPLIAVPAYLFVDAFHPFLPIGLGLAAGAMIWMVFSEIIPESLENGKKEHIALLVTLSIALMVIMQDLIKV